MVRRRPKARRTSSRRRKRKYRKKWSRHVIPRRFKLYLPHMSDLLDDELTKYSDIEQQTIDECERKGIPENEVPNYIAFAKRIWEVYMTFWNQTADKEVELLQQEFTLRGLVSAVLSQIKSFCLRKAYIARGLIMLPAWAYNNVIGKIWLPEPKGTYGGYYDNVTGKIWVAEPKGTYGGYYDNRF